MATVLSLQTLGSATAAENEDASSISVFCGSSDASSLSWICRDHE